jgi:hydroxymethylglutaryl-CoA reductase
MVDSKLCGFYRLSMARRREHIARLTGLSDEDLRVISGEQGLDAEQADHMVENALGVVGVPLGVCVNLQVDGEDWLVPMAIEEASVIAAASHAAKLLRVGGGVRTEVSPPVMIGQIQLLEVPDPEAAREAISGARDELLAAANALDPCLVSVGGGARDLELRLLPPLQERDDPLGPMLVVHLLVDVGDAMGANTVNSMCEHLAPRFEELSGGRARLRIVSNMADRRVVSASGWLPFSALEGKGGRGPEDLARGIEEASVFAERDPYRAATHNKGIMNGIDAVLLAFGQDWRAVEAGAHAFAARDGRYSSLTRWRVRDGALYGRLELPLAVGVVGGVTAVHPAVGVARRIARISSARELAAVAASVGLAQNLGALRALAAEGIQRGHMRVHARNMAMAAGAVGPEVEQVASGIADRGQVTLAAARESLQQVRSGSEASRNPVAERFDALRETYLPRIMQQIDELLQPTGHDESALSRMASYQMRTGGKRLRALLPLLVAESLGADPEQFIPFGAACEMLHNATLVHDDLQDGDRVRRGQETIWQRYGAAQAINLGDAMFYYTLQLVQRLDVVVTRREAVFRRVVSETLRVIDGQGREFEMKRKPTPTLEEYFRMVDGKTSGLFALPMSGAAALCGMIPAVVDGLQEAARHMGVLFQLQDDVLDLYGEKGRDARGSDVREGKRSVMVIHALQRAPRDEARRLRQVLDLDREQTTGEDIAWASELFERVGSLAFALDEIGRRKERARGVAALLDHQQLQSVVEAMCDLFLRPIEPVLERHAGRASPR